MLELRLDPRLPEELREPFLREARRSGIALADLEALSYDHRLVRSFLAAVREGKAIAFVRALDAETLAAGMAKAVAPVPLPPPRRKPA